jgi:hypothetical protein
MKVYKVERTNKISWCEDVLMVVVAEDELHAERCARLKSDDFRRAPLKVTEVDLETEAVISVENTGA